MRERHGLGLSYIVLVRITPARAGKTIEAILVIVKAEDHPRSCGKDASDMSRTILTMGSPPLVRERLTSASIRQSSVRITPARAGKTDDDSTEVTDYEDHPRSCGKDSLAFIRLFGNWGSPPLVRERHIPCPCTFTAAGIPPARAGKTQCRF